MVDRSIAAFCYVTVDDVVPVADMAFLDDIMIVDCCDPKVGGNRRDKYYKYTHVEFFTVHEKERRQGQYCGARKHIVFRCHS